jgi:hypothetical protein
MDVHRRVVPHFELHARESSTCVQQADQPIEIRSDLGIPSAAIQLST